eukprot:TRINITY_DN37121_c0_g1_i1.p1 TRINITY_DN37121_c0_g1~~TRINITY_DN37121_c0_g1_i1.p1  ORF type:complete len:122 (+),score=39.02 TRINITY_DN37121_c0_g1_i1:65-430(+)
MGEVSEKALIDYEVLKNTEDTNQVYDGIIDGNLVKTQDCLKLVNEYEEIKQRIEQKKQVLSAKVDSIRDLNAKLESRAVPDIDSIFAAEEDEEVTDTKEYFAVRLNYHRVSAKKECFIKGL